MLKDQWTIVTKDGQPAAHFEHTVVVTETGVDILTSGRPVAVPT
jgi:methionyl aminopeptidase